MDIDVPISQDIPCKTVKSRVTTPHPQPLSPGGRGEHGTHFFVAVITAERDDYILLEPVQQQLKQQRQQRLQGNQQQWIAHNHLLITFTESLQPTNQPGILTQELTTGIRHRREAGEGTG